MYVAIETIICLVFGLFVHHFLKNSIASRVKQSKIASSSPEEYTVFVRGLPQDATQEDVANFFSGAYNLENKNAITHPFGINESGCRFLFSWGFVLCYLAGVAAFDGNNDESLVEYLLNQIISDPARRPSGITTSVLSYVGVIVGAALTYLIGALIARTQDIGGSMTRLTPREIFDEMEKGTKKKNGQGTTILKKLRKRSKGVNKSKVYVAGDDDDDDGGGGGDGDEGEGGGMSEQLQSSGADAAWVQYFDPASSSLYYFNDVTLESSWEPPANFRPCLSPTNASDGAEAATAQNSIPMPVHVASVGDDGGRSVVSSSKRVSVSEILCDELVSHPNTPKSVSYAFAFNGMWVTEVTMIRPLGNLIRRFRAHEKLLYEISNAWDSVNKYRTMINHSYGTDDPADDPASGSSSVEKNNDAEAAAEHNDAEAAAERKDAEAPPPLKSAVKDGATIQIKLKADAMKLENLERKKRFAVEKLKTLKNKMENLNWQICGKMNPNNLSICVGAFVTFEHQESRNRCLEDYKLSTTWLGKKFQPDTLQFTHPTKIDKKTGKFQTYRLTVTRAPQPAGVLWENLEFSYATKLQHRMKTALATLCFLFLSFVLIYFAYSMKAQMLLAIPNLGRCNVLPAIYYGTYPPPVEGGLNPNYYPTSSVHLVRDKLLDGSVCGSNKFYLTYEEADPDPSAPQSLDHDNLPSLVVPPSILEPSFSTRTRGGFTCEDPSCDKLNVKDLEECQSSCQPTKHNDEYCPTLACGISEWSLEENGGHKCELYKSSLPSACYCYDKMINVMRSDGWSGMTTLRAEESDMCGAIFWEYFYAAASAGVAAVSILGVNLAIGSLIDSFVQDELHSSWSGQARAAFAKISVAQFLNTAVTTVIANAYIEYGGGLKDFLDSVGFLGGQHKDFTKGWYQSVGVSLTMTMLINTLVPHFILQFLTIFVFTPLKRRILGRFAVNQSSLDIIYEGPKFSIEKRYAFALNTVMVTMVFSGGLPILFPLACLNFAIMGISDRYFLLKVSQQPPSYDSRLAVLFKNAMSIALILHVFVTCYMYSSRISNDSDIKLMRADSITNTGLENLFGQPGSAGREFFNDRIASWNTFPIFVLGRIYSLCLFLTTFFNVNRLYKSVRSLLAANDAVVSSFYPPGYTSPWYSVLSLEQEEHVKHFKRLSKVDRDKGYRLKELQHRMIINRVNPEDDDGTVKKGNTEKNHRAKRNLSSGKNKSLLPTYLVAQLDGVLHTYEMAKNAHYANENSFLKSFQNFAINVGVGESRDVDVIGGEAQQKMVELRNQMMNEMAAIEEAHKLRDREQSQIVENMAGKNFLIAVKNKRNEKKLKEQEDRIRVRNVHNMGQNMKNIIELRAAERRLELQQATIVELNVKACVSDMINKIVEGDGGINWREKGLGNDSQIAADEPREAAAGSGAVAISENGEAERLIATQREMIVEMSVRACVLDVVAKVVEKNGPGVTTSVSVIDEKTEGLNAPGTVNYRSLLEKENEIVQLNVISCLNDMMLDIVEGSKRDERLAPGSNAGTNDITTANTTKGNSQGTTEIIAPELKNLLDEMVVTVMRRDVIDRSETLKKRECMSSAMRMSTEMQRSHSRSPRSASDSAFVTRDNVSEVLQKLVSDVESAILREQNGYLRASIIFEKEIKRQKRRQNKGLHKKTPKKEQKKKKDRKSQKERKHSSERKGSKTRPRRMTPSDFFDATEFLVSNNDELERAQVELSLSMLVHAVELRATTNDNIEEVKLDNSTPSLLKFIQLEEELADLKHVNARLEVAAVVNDLVHSCERSVPSFAPRTTAPNVANDNDNDNASVDASGRVAVETMIENVAAADVLVLKEIELEVSNSISTIVATIEFNDVIRHLKAQALEQEEMLATKDTIIEQITNHVTEMEEERLLAEEGDEALSAVEKVIALIVDNANEQIISNSLLAAEKELEEMMQRTRNLEKNIEAEKVKAEGEREVLNGALHEQTKLATSLQRAKDERDRLAAELLEEQQKANDERDRLAAELLEEQQKANDERDRLAAKLLEEQQKANDERDRLAKALLQEQQNDNNERLKLQMSIESTKRTLNEMLGKKEVNICLNNVVLEIERRANEQKLLASAKRERELLSDVEVLKAQARGSLETILNIENEKFKVEEQVTKDLSRKFETLLEEKEIQTKDMLDTITREKDGEKEVLARSLEEEKERITKAMAEEKDKLVAARKELESKLHQATISHQAAIREEGILVKATMEESFRLKNEVNAKVEELAANQVALDRSEKYLLELQKQLTEERGKNDIQHSIEDIKTELLQATIKQKEEFNLQKRALEEELRLQKEETEKIRVDNQQRVEENLKKLSEAVEAIKTNQEEASMMSAVREDHTLGETSMGEMMVESFGNSDSLAAAKQELEDQRNDLSAQREKMETKLEELRARDSLVTKKKEEHEETLKQLKRALRRVVQMKQKEYDNDLAHEQEVSGLQKKLDDALLDKEVAKEEMHETEKLILNMTANMEKERADKKKVIAQLHASVKEASAVGTEKEIFRSELKALKAAQNSERQKFHKMLDRLKEQVKEVHIFEEELQLAKEAKEKLTLELKKEQEMRKANFNAIQDLMGKIRVLVRVRPMLPNELDRRSESVVKVLSKTSLEIKVAKKNNRAPMEFSFDEVLGPKTSQKDTFDRVKGLIGSVIDGYNVTLFCYGQTGSGKTFTMAGGGDKNIDNVGLIPRAIESLFDNLQKKGDHYAFNVKSCFVELYCNRLIDLYGDDNALALHEQAKKLEIKLDATRMVYVKNACIRTADDADDLIDAWASAESKNRHSASTEMNDASSRSHSVLSILVELKSLTTGTTTTGKLSLIDLAGSEKVSKSGVTGANLQEARNINQSLSCLSDVIAALSNGAKHVPYRNNKLTQLMQDSLGGNAKTLMIVNISPSDFNSEESVMSLHYGTRAKLIKNRAKKNEESSEISRLKSIIEGLRDELEEERRTQEDMKEAEAPQDITNYKIQEGEKKIVGGEIDFTGQKGVVPG